MKLVNTDYNVEDDVFIFHYEAGNSRVGREPADLDEYKGALQEIRHKLKFYLGEYKRLNDELEGYLASKPR